MFYLPKIRKKMRQYPIGIQDFARIINRNMVYVDKTDLVYQLASVGCQVCV